MKTILICVLAVLGGIAANADVHTNLPCDLGDDLQNFIEWAQGQIDGDTFRNINAEDLKNIFIDIQSKEKLTQEIRNLEIQKHENESDLNQRKTELMQIDQKIALTKLTPAQLATITKYNESLKPHVTAYEWITFQIPWDACVAFLLTFAFNLPTRFEETFENRGFCKLAPQARVKTELVGTLP